jgi:isoleucyl-tRNA synthetase
MAHSKGDERDKAAAGGADFKQTLNLPHTDFPMRANLPQREPEVQRRWEEMGLYRLMLEKNAGRPRFILHDGPPYTSGDIHLGQALNKVLKDFVVRFKTMRGFLAPFVPGWDMHGLPTEMRALESFQQYWRQISPLELRARCLETAKHFLEAQRSQFRRLGCVGDWEKPYLTVDPVYESAVIGMFGDIVKTGAVYRGLKPVHWCATCETALAGMEIEYKDHTSYSIYVSFRLSDSISRIFPEVGDRPASMMVWTTTPWTLPANVALAVHPEFEYAAVQSGDHVFVLARELVEQVMAEIGRRDWQVLGTARGEQLNGLVAYHPFMASDADPSVPRESRVILTDYVTMEQGTGVVHTAPGHGKEDFQAGQEYGLPVIQPLDDRGYFTQQGGQFAGMRFDEADPAIVSELERRGALLKTGQITHSYPHCWRCEQPVLLRAARQWFMSVANFAQQALSEIEKVTWWPAGSKVRISSMVQESPDWCISRQRVWGIPIPAFYCQDCGEALLTPESIEAARKLVAGQGSDAWWSTDASEILPKGTKCQACGSAKFRKETDTFSVWVDSGCSHAAVLETRPGLAWPADLYLEGHDQHRLWFQASLWTGVAARGAAPYKGVLTHGFCLDERGRKMSKHLGNVVDPQEVIQKYGADILRLWATYVDYQSDMPTSVAVFDQVAESYRRLRNTLRFMLANLYDFDPQRHLVPPQQMRELDRWALHRLHGLIQQATRAYEQWDFHGVYHRLNEFCATDLSAFYLDVLKDTLYCEAADSTSRRSAQTALWHLADNLIRLMAVIVAHTAEEAWRTLPHLPGQESRSVHLTDWPEPSPEWADESLAERWERVLVVREEVQKALEVARQARRIGQPLEAAVSIVPPMREVGKPTAEGDVLLSVAPQVTSVLIVSAANVEKSEEDLLKRRPELVAVGWQSERLEGMSVYVERARGKRCARCWLTKPDVGDTGLPGSAKGLCQRCVRVVGGQASATAEPV